MSYITIILVSIICIAACHIIASKRGANPVFWALMGALFGPFAIPFVLFAKPKAKPEQEV